MGSAALDSAAWSWTWLLWAGLLGWAVLSYLVIGCLSLEACCSMPASCRDCLARMTPAQMEPALVWIQSPTHSLALLRDDLGELADIDLRIVHVAAMAPDADPMALSEWLEKQLTAELTELTEQSSELVLPEVDSKTPLAKQAEDAAFRIKEVVELSLVALGLWEALSQRHKKRVRHIVKLGCYSCLVDCWNLVEVGLLFLSCGLLELD